jgi:hypothetical protein
MTLYIFKKSLDGRAVGEEGVDAPNDSVARELANIFASEADIDVWRNGTLVAKVPKR